MKRRSFLAGLLAAPLVKFLPVPKPAPVVTGVDLGGSDSTSIWLVDWGENTVYAAGDYTFYAGTPVLPMRTNWLKKELNK